MILDDILALCPEHALARMGWRIVNACGDHCQHRRRLLGDKGNDLRHGLVEESPIGLGREPLGC